MTDDTLDPDEFNRTERHVLNTILKQSNDIQGEWVSKQELKTVLVAHGSLDSPDVEEALHQLFIRDLIEVDEGSYRPGNDASRVPHPGESTD